MLVDVPFTISGLVYATFMGAMSGAVTNGIGTIANSIPQFGLRLTFQALAHGTFQGIMSGVQGGNFWNGFASGALSSIASSVWQGGKLAGGDGNWGGAGGSWGNSDFGTIAFGTVAGGAGAALSGGNFWEGAVTGLFVSALNHTLHPNDSYEEFDQEDPIQKVKYDPVDASKLDERFNTNGKTWEKKGGRWTITTKKEILQWDALHGEVEIYNKGTKTHLGSSSPFDRTITKPGKGYTPSGGWKVTTSKMLKVMSKLDKIMNYIPILNFPVTPVFEMQLQMLKNDYFTPQQTSY
jgi:Cytotoxic